MIKRISESAHSRVKVMGREKRKKNDFTCCGERGELCYRAVGVQERERVGFSEDDRPG